MTGIPWTPSVVDSNGRMSDDDMSVYLADVHPALVHAQMTALVREFVILAMIDRMDEGY